MEPRPVSTKMKCPSCEAYTSAVYAAYGEGRPCPYCALPADVAAKVLEARKRGADEDLTQRCQEALVRAGKAEAEVAQLRRHLEAIKQAVANPPEPVASTGPAPMADDEALVAFLEQRLAEDERWALAASASYHSDEPYTVPGGMHWTWGVGPNWTPVDVDPTMSYVGEDDLDNAGRLTLVTVETFPCLGMRPLQGRVLAYVEDVRTGDGGHIVRHDPARVLRDVQAKRALIRRYKTASDAVESAFGQSRPAVKLCRAHFWVALRLLAEVWAEHPDFREEWRT